MKKEEIRIRDPFILSFEGKYYMYGSRVGEQQGFDVYISVDLENWRGPKAVFEYYDGFWGEKEFGLQKYICIRTSFICLRLLKEPDCVVELLF